MAKDDYFVLVYKILAYLYTILKEGRHPDPQKNFYLTKTLCIECYQ